VDDIPMGSDLTAFIVRARRAGGAPMIFIPGMCVHPRDYMLTFREAAAERGDLVAVQGDVPCNGYGRSWSNDLVAMDRRIEAAFAAAGLGPPRDAVILGYSMGADRVESLVARFPDKYRAAVLIASSRVPSPQQLRRL
jgi:pimeloyl-ACP methyl ester carboxylesterase